MRFRAAVSITFISLLSAASAAAQTSEPVQWDPNSLVHVVTTGTQNNGLLKNSGCDGCTDAGAISVQTFATGDGYVEFVAPDTTKSLWVGLSNGNTGTGHAEIKWSIHLNGAADAEVRENDVYRTDIAFAANATFRIAVVGTSVQYSKDGQVFYTSLIAPTYPILVDTSFTSLNGSITGAMFSPASTGATSPCGLKDDTVVRTPASYDTWTPPARGANYVDSVFNCTITRLTDGIAQFGLPARHVYSSISAFNHDSTRLLLTTNGSFFVTDLSGNVVVNTTALGIGTNNEALWSRIDPNVIYYHSGNQIKSVNISNLGVRNTIATLTGAANLSFGGGEADLSDDGNYVVILGEDSSYHPQTIQVFQFSADHTSGTFLSGGLAILSTSHLDWCDMTSSNRVLCMWTDAGTGSQQGTELYSNTMVFTRQVVPFDAHSDRGKDTDGSEIVVTMSGADANPAIGCNRSGIGSGVEKINVQSSAKTCLIQYQTWSAAAHISINGPHGYVLVDQLHTPSVTVSSPYPNGTADQPAESNWQTDWKLYFNEVDLVSLDGAHIWRLAHHRSRRPPSTAQGGCISAPYWYEPRSSISPDGKYVVFDSNFNQPSSPSCNDFTDVFLIHVQ